MLYDQNSCVKERDREYSITGNDARLTRLASISATMMLTAGPDSELTVKLAGLHDTQQPLETL